MSPLELRLCVRLLEIHEDVAEHKKDNRCDIGLAPDSEPKSRQACPQGNGREDFHAQRGHKEKEGESCNQEHRANTFEHRQGTQHQCQIDIQRESGLSSHKLHGEHEQGRQVDDEVRKPLAERIAVAPPEVVEYLQLDVILNDIPSKPRAAK